MMRMSTKSSSTAPAAADNSLEVRPCGMLVQKRDPNSEPASAPTIRVRVKFGSASHDVYVSSQATFGELKKLVSGPTGLHPLDQKILFKDKERESTAYLDTAGVKDRSKIVVLEDLKARDKRCLEMRRAARVEEAKKSIAKVGVEVDRLASKVSAIESIVLKGKRVAESDVLNLLELLMNELLKLDAITADGDVKLQRRMQVRRVQKYVETLDIIKIKNSLNINNECKKNMKQSKPTTMAMTPTMTTGKWEASDSLFSPSWTKATSSASSSTSSSSNPTPRLDWELF